MSWLTRVGQKYIFDVNRWTANEIADDEPRNKKGANDCQHYPWSDLEVTCTLNFPARSRIRDVLAPRSG